MRRKDVLEVIVMGVIAIGLLVTFTGCRGVETMYSRNTLPDAATIEVTSKDGTVTKTQLPKGTVMEVTKRTADESLLTDQALAGSGSVQAMKIVPTGDSSTPMFEVILGGGNNAFGKAPADSNQPVYAYSRSMSVWGSIASATATGVSFIYIGSKGETAAETAKRVDALNKAAGVEQAANTGTPAK